MMNYDILDAVENVENLPENIWDGGGAEFTKFETGERVIGTYNGKPLYRNIATGTTKATDNAITAFTAPIDTLVSMDGMIILNGGYRVPIIFNDNSNCVSMGGNATGTWVRGRTNAAFNCPFIVIATYTKTTD